MNEITRILMEMEEKPYEEWFRDDRMIVMDWCEEYGHSNLREWLDECCFDMNGFMPLEVPRRGRLLQFSVSRIDPFIALDKNARLDQLIDFVVGRQVGRQVWPVMVEPLRYNQRFSWESNDLSYIERFEEPLWIGTDHLLTMGALLFVKWRGASAKTGKLSGKITNERTSLGRNIIERSRRWQVWRQFANAGLVSGFRVAKSDPAWTLRHYTPIG